MTRRRCLRGRRRVWHRRAAPRAGKEAPVRSPGQPPLGGAPGNIEPPAGAPPYRGMWTSNPLRCAVRVRLQWIHPPGATSPLALGGYTHRGHDHLERPDDIIRTGPEFAGRASG
ncbi:hypothetical protein GCM10027089_60200 [Nocardia thraciensis]